MERRADGWHASLIAVAYDPAPMARLAAARGRADWAVALTRGTVD